MKILFLGLMFILLTTVSGTYLSKLVSEREATRAEAVEDVSTKWGAPQTLTGPILIVPYQEKDQDGNLSTNYAHILPENLEIKGSINTEIRRRGIYDVPVYKSDLSLSGDFKAIDLAVLGLTPEEILWQEVYLAIGLSDLKGLGAISLAWDEKDLALEPGISDKNLLASGLSAKLAMQGSDESAHHFQIGLSTQGSKSIFFTPVGGKTTIELSSNWTDPSFDGTFLPKEYDLTQEGFSAFWEVLYLNRDYPQEWKGDAYSIKTSNLGVELFTPADTYQKVTRSVKYMALFVFLTFFSFFFIESLNREKLHPIHYALVGSALVVFYLLLLSLSEHIGFGPSYSIATASIVGLIVTYSQSILHSKKLAYVVATILLILYSTLYVILQMTDYALLIGSVLIFLTLAVVMQLTRKVDWYKLG